MDRIVEKYDNLIDPRKHSILIVDDVPASLAAVANELSQHGFQVKIARTGEIGLGIARRTLPELILLDVKLPDVDGFEVCRRLKADEETREIPVIFMTVMTETIHKVRGFEVGGVDYIAKPVQREEVLARVTTHLRLRDLTRKLEEAKESLERRVMERTSELAKANVSLTQEIFERKQTEAALVASEQEYRSLAENSPDSIIRYDRHSRAIYCNPMMTQSLGVDAETLLGKTPTELAGSIPLEVSAEFENQLRQTMESGESSEIEIGVPHPGGESRAYLIRFVAERDTQGNIVGVLAIGRDITERKAAAAEIEHLAYHDTLTQLPNRRLLLYRLEQALAAGARKPNWGTLLFIDLDDFKFLNDTRGHVAGDKLLVDVARRLLRCVRKEDTVARVGGDEFMIILNDLGKNAHDAAKRSKDVGNKILLELNRPYMIAGYEHHSTPSMGITLFCGTEYSLNEVIKQADIAMYQAKAGGRNTLRFFDPAMQAVLAERAELEVALRRGIEERQFLIYYQPQVDSARGIIGAELLLRWKHPERGLVSPIEFIPLAEESGLILPIGQWVLETACRQLKAWANHPRTRELCLAVNVSQHQFRQADFVDQVRLALEESDAPPVQLKIELTESLLIDEIEDSIKKMHALKALEVEFSLDDFGTGYSSLSYLTRLPLEQLKIDKSFVRNLPRNHYDAVLTQTIITMAQSLDLSVIAEGVETESQRHFLEQCGCTTYQGYLFSEPVSLADFEKLLEIESSLQ